MDSNLLSKKPDKDLFYFFYCTQNLRQSELAMKFGVSEKTICVWRREFGIPKRLHRNVAHPRFNPPKEELERLYAELKSSVKVGQYYGVDSTTVLCCLKRYGIAVQPVITKLPSWNTGLTKATSDKVRLVSEKSAKARVGLMVGDLNPATRPEVRAKIGLSLKQRWQNANGRSVLLESFKTRPEIWNKGKTNIYSAEMIAHMSSIRKGINYVNRFGLEKANEIRKKLSEHKSGHNNPMWNNPVLARTVKRDTSIEREMKRELLSRNIMCFVTNKFLHGYVGDIVFPNHNLVVECDGCYWHGCKQCKPWKDQEINDDRILGNVDRSKRKDELLIGEGWTVLRFWEHDIKADVKGCVDQIESYLKKGELENAN